MTKARGFTLLEMIISMLIISAIVLMIYTSYALVVRTWKKNQEQTADFRLEVIGERLLRADWQQIVPYTFGTERGQYAFLSGSPRHLTYVTTHGLGAQRSLGGGLFFTLLLLKAVDEQVNLYCYKADWPDKDLMLLSRLYQAGGQDPQIEPLEAQFIAEALVLKTVDEAVFSFDIKSANETQTLLVHKEEELEQGVLPLKEWQALDLPQRIRLTWRDDQWLTWVDGEVPQVLDEDLEDEEDLDEP